VGGLDTGGGLGVMALGCTGCDVAAVDVSPGGRWLAYWLLVCVCTVS